MNDVLSCEEVEALARDLVTPAAVIDPSVRARALVHADGCPACGARLERERMLSARLAPLRIAEEQPPAALEGRLQRAFRARTKEPAARPPRRVIWFVGAGALAVAGLVAAVLLWPTPPPRPARPPFADRLSFGRVARVELSAEVAAHYGWPVLPDTPGARVAADVLIGEDGVARAVRLLPATFTTTPRTQPEENTP
jgi:hypothetical protein